MGSIEYFEKQRRGGRSPGKIDASLNEKLRRVKWGEYKLGELFEICSSKKIFHANELPEIYESKVSGSFPYVVRSTQNNGVKGYIKENYDYANDGGTLSFAQDTFSVFYQKEKYFTGNKVKILKPLFNVKNENVLIFIVAGCNNSLKALSWGMGSTVETIENFIIQLPQTENGEIDFEFMETFVAELQFRRVAELEAYLSATGLKDYTLTEKEKYALENYEKLNWSTYNLENLFGKSTRGKRLKSEDRIAGKLPFVTAGEACEGISAFIGNSVEIFNTNTITIDMFGSAKYRNYNYGGDDHIAVVHTEKLPYKAAVFITSAIHKSSHTGKFDYGHNFYAKDADSLDIVLPDKNGIPDYEYMELLISAIQKIVIKNVVLYADKQIAATQKVINKNF